MENINKSKAVQNVFTMFIITLIFRTELSAIYFPLNPLQKLTDIQMIVKFGLGFCYLLAVVNFILAFLWSKGSSDE